MERRAYLRILTSAFFTFVFLMIMPQVANAANLYFSPSSGSHAVGAVLSVSVYVSSADQAMNAASGIILFPQDKLEVSSLSKMGSIFGLWVQEPSFSNSGGTINFEGIVLNPGFTGPAGKILTINFRVKAAGQASLTFSSGSALANDGKGTNILTGLGNATFSLGGAVSTTVPEAAPGKSTAPGGPVLSSPTHPDPDKWYANDNPTLTWKLSPEITGVRLLVGRLPRAIPTISYAPPVSSKELSALEDGVWYFHARLRNSAGWGDTSHFRFQIDTEKPDRFDITEIVRSDLTDPKVKFTFDANDKTSGIDHYEVSIDNESPQIWQDDGSHIYETNALSSGRHILIAGAADKAGNTLANSAEFMVEKLLVQAVDDRSAQSKPSDTVTTAVGRPAFLKLGSWAISVLSVVVPLVALTFILLFIIWHGWHKFSLFRKKLKKEVHEAGSVLHRTFDLLKEDIREQVKMLEKTKTRRELTNEEEKVIRRLKKDLDDAEKFVREEIEDIEREIKE